MPMQFTTLIPAYKPKYLIELMACLRHQTVKPARVIVSDDSPDRTFTAMLGSEPLKSMLADLNVEVIDGPRSGGYNNFRHLFRHFSARVEHTELFHVLLDDDLIYPSFYEQHLQAHNMGTLQCVVSRRWACNELGQPIKDDLVVPTLVSDHQQRLLALSVDALFISAIAAGRNWLGEFSNATFRAEMASELIDLQLSGINCAGLEDLMAFVKASLRGPLGYINAHLGSFRQSDNQNSAQPMGRPLKLAFTAYVAMVTIGRNLGRINIEDAEAAIRRIGAFVLLHYSQQQDMAGICRALHQLVQGEWEAESEFLREWHLYAGDPRGQDVPVMLSGSPRVTVLMPVYNGARFLPATLASLRAQTLNDFEVLCMDDASTDDSLRILQGAAQVDSRFRVLSMSSNLGSVPPVINRSLGQVRGNWCVYTSQDDKYSPNWLSSMVERAAATGADAVIPDVVFYYENEPQRQTALVGLRGDRRVELTGREAVVHSLDWTIPGNALWRSSMVKQLRYADFSTNGDEYTARVFFLQCQKVVFCDGQFLYRQDNADAITKKITVRSFDIPYTYLRLAQFLLDKGFDPHLAQREVAKAQSALAELLGWLQAQGAALAPEGLADAQRRVARCAELLAVPQIQGLSHSTEATA